MEHTLTKTTFPKYPAYKDSGVAWLGEIPNEWKVKKLKYLGSIYAGLNGKKGDDFSKFKKSGFSEFIPFTNIYNNIVINEGQMQYVDVSDSESQNLVKNGDILFLMSSETLEDIGKCSLYQSETPRFLNSFCKGVRLNSKDVIPTYVNFLFQAESFRKYFSIVGRGFTRINIKQEYVNELPTLLPPLSEQTAIAHFLDEKTSKIDQAIAQKEQLIELLKERKQIIIQNAVTKGLNPNVQLKDSGVEWIGEIPKHWEVKRLKNLIKDLESGVSVNASESESASKKEIGVLKTSAVYSYSFDSLANKKVFKSDLRRVSCPVKKGRIIISRMNAPDLVGASGYVKESYPNLFLPDRLWQTVYHSNIEFDSFWLSIVLTTISFRAVITSLANGSSPSMKNISKPDFLNIRIPFPSHKEQIVIVNNIKSQSAEIDQSINLQQTQISTLKEYKATLIDSAVTGKIKVS